MMNELKDIVTAMALFGIPSLFTCAVFFVRACVKFSHKIDILMGAVQKQMRRDLTQDYHKYMDAGYIDDDDLDLWMSQFTSYHDLGKNGVMDARRDDLIELNGKHGRITFGVEKHG